jgi:hypothetical protein
MARGIYNGTPAPIVFTSENVEDTQHAPENRFGAEDNTFGLRDDDSE